MYRWKTNTIWLILIVGTLGWGLVGTAGASSRLSTQEARYTRVAQSLHQLQLRHTRQLRRVKAAAQKLSFLKRQASRGGIFALPARVRLPRVRAEAQRLTRRLSVLTGQIRAQRTLLKRTRRQLFHLYRQEGKRVRKALRAAKGAQRRVLARRLTQLKQRSQKLRQGSTRRKAGTALPQLRVNIDPLDGPRELRQKADRLKDQEDHVKRLMAKLQKKIKRVRRKLKRQRSEQKLSKYVDDVDDTDGMFQENARNPRVVTGAQTSRKLRARGNNQETDAASKGQQGFQAAPNAPSNSKENPSSPPPAAAPGVTDSSGPTNRGGSDPGKVGTGTGTGTGGSLYGVVTKIQPSQGVNPSLQPRRGVAGKLGSLTLNPKGSAKQQLEALKRYKKYLQRHIHLLKNNQKQILKRAQKLKRERRRR